MCPLRRGAGGGAVSAEVEVRHPAEFTPAILDTLAPVIERYGLPVFDPFAGVGLRLGALCDSVGVRFAGVDLEDWPGADPRVARGDATDPNAYASEPVLLVTSPTYGNGLNDHFRPREGSRRLTYRTSLGRDLHERNTGRHGLRGGHKSWGRYWGLHGDAVALWSALGLPVVLNVKAFIHRGRVVDLPGQWADLLAGYGYGVSERLEVPCPGYRFGSNRGARVPTEAVLLAEVAR